MYFHLHLTYLSNRCLRNQSSFKLISNTKGHISQNFQVFSKKIRGDKVIWFSPSWPAPQWNCWKQLVMGKMGVKDRRVERSPHKLGNQPVLPTHSAVDTSGTVCKHLEKNRHMFENQCQKCAKPLKALPVNMVTEEKAWNRCGYVGKSLTPQKRTPLMFFYINSDYRLCSVFHRVKFLATPWTVAYQTPLSMELSG